MRQVAVRKSLRRFAIVMSVALAAAGLAFGSAATPAQAADTIELTFSGLWPPAHPISVANKMWIEKIEKETNGRVKIKPFWAGGLYRPKESALELGKGVADIGELSGAYAPKGYDFEKSMRMVFWGVDDRQLARKVYYAALQKFPELEQEFTDGNVKVMAYASVPPYQLLLAKKKVSSTADFQGLTLKTSGDLAKVASAFGADGIVMSMGDAYTALQKTTIDGVFAPFETLKSFRFAEVVGYALKLNIAAAPAGHWAFNLDSWNKLPKDVQQVFLGNRDWFGNKIEELLYAGEDQGIALAKEHKVEFVTMPPEELDKVYAVVDKTIREEMAKLDAQGLKGTEVYQYIRDQIKENQK